MAEQVMSISKIFKESKYTAQLHGMKDFADDFANFCWLEWHEAGEPKKFRFDYAWTHFYSATFGSKKARENYYAAEKAKLALKDYERGTDLIDLKSKSIWDAEEDSLDNLPIQSFSIKPNDLIAKTKSHLKLIKGTLFFKSKEWKKYRDELDPLIVDWIKI